MSFFSPQGAATFQELSAVWSEFVRVKLKVGEADINSYLANVENMVSS
jgi:hypothetical protein